MGMVGEACLPNTAYYPRTPDYTLYSGVHVCWSEVRGKDTKEMLQFRNRALPGHQKKKRRGTNNDKASATHETTDTQTKKNYNRRTALERSVGKLLRGGKPVLHARDLTLILMQLQL